VPKSLNLASKPFSNRSLPWAVTALIILFSMIGLFFIVRASRHTSLEAQAIQNDINSLRQEEQSFRQKAEAVKKSLTPQQLQTLTAAHTLLDRKHFSWSQLFADLELALPGDVRVKRIDVSGVAKQGEQTVTELELTVIARNPSIVTQMVGEMDRNGVFHAEIRSETIQRGRGESGSEYDLLVVYRPRAGAATEAASVASIETAGDLAKGEKR